MSLQRISFAEACAFSRAGEGTFSGSNGLLQTAAAGVPRFDYDPVTLAPKGILIEGGRTNLMLSSSDFGHANWTKSEVTVGSNVAVAPDGTMTADCLVESSSNAFHVVSQYVSSFPALTTCTILVYLKAAGRTKVRLQTDASAGAANMDIDLALGTSPSGSALGRTVTAVGNGWFRCEFRLTSDADGGAVGLKVLLVDVSYSSAYLGDGVSGVYVWGAQIETGNFSSSYTPTTTMAISRTADILTVQPAQFAAAFRQDAGTILIDMTLNHTGLNSTGGNDFPFLLDMDSAAAPGDGYRMIASAGYGPGYKIEVTTGASLVAGLTFAKALGGGSRTKLALSWGGANDFAACMDGGAVQTDTSGAIPAPDRLSIGCQDSSGNQMFGHVREVLFFPNKFTGAQLQEATTI